MASNGQGAKSSNVWTSARATQKKQALSSAGGGEPSETSSSQSSRGSSASRWADPPTAQAPQNTVQRGSSSSHRSSSSSTIESDGGRWAGTSKNRGPISGSQLQGQTSRQQPNSLNTASSGVPVHSDLRRRDANQPLGGEIDPMSLIASPSRGIQGSQSASLGSAGDQDLTNFSTQARFREYISTRIRAHCEKHPRTTLQDLIPSWLPDGWEKETTSGTAVASAESRAARNGLEEVLLLVRKLREGIMASRRSDGAALEVYSLALFLALITLNRAQLSATIHRVVFDLYPNVDVSEAATSSWTSNVPADFAPIAGAHSNQTQLFVDSLESRQHTASLLLLSHSCLSSTRQPGSLEDSFPELKHRVLRALSLERAEDSFALTLACEVDRALRQNNVPLFRRLLTGGHVIAGSGKILQPPTLWQKMLLAQSLPRVREMAWNQLKRAYLTLPLPSVVTPRERGESRELSSKLDVMTLGREESSSDAQWLERTLLIDTSLVPVHEQSASAQPTPDEWDDDDAKSTSITGTDSAARCHRLSMVFDRNGLAAAATTAAAKSNGDHGAPPVAPQLQPWAGRITFNATTGRSSIKIR